MWIVKRAIWWKTRKAEIIQTKSERQRQDEYKLIYIENRVKEKIRPR